MKKTAQKTTVNRLFFVIFVQSPNPSAYLNVFIILCVCVLVFDSILVNLCVSSGSAAPSGVCTLNGWGECWPLLSIKGSIDWKHESVSAASHPWTADNGSWTRGDIAESNQQALDRKCSSAA